MASDVRPFVTRFSLFIYICLFFITSVTGAFYVPGYSITSYKQGENIPLLVNKIYSDNTRPQFAYFDLPFVCPPSGNRQNGSNWASGQYLSQDLGEVLRGDRKCNSDFEINMGQDVECAFLCDRSVSGRNVQWAQELIKHGYLTEWILDDLPGATLFTTIDRKRRYYTAGFKIGTPTYYINNHFTLLVRWRLAPGSAGESGRKVVTGFEVYTRSINADRRDASGCSLDILNDQHPPLPLRLSQNTTLAKEYVDSSYRPPPSIDLDASSMTIPYTYSVYFREENAIEWANRWEVYLNDQHELTTTRWLALLNAIVTSTVLGAVCVTVWIRTTSGDSRLQIPALLEEAKLLTRKRNDRPAVPVSEKVLDSATSDLPDDETVEDLAGWKVLHADVFRTPPYAAFLAPLMGSGLQLVFTLVSLLILSCFGVLNLSWRDGFALFVLAGALSGYLSARVYKTFGGTHFKRNALMTALPFPTLLIMQTLLLNTVTWLSASSTAVSFTTLLLLLFIWFVIQLPLVHAGSILGSRRAAYTHPTRTATTPRPIPSANSANTTTSWYTRLTSTGTSTTKTILLCLIAGFPPFSILLIELPSLISSPNLYTVSPPILLLHLFTTTQCTLLHLFLLLASENWSWWWPTFYTGASSSLYIFVYSIFSSTASTQPTSSTRTLLFLIYITAGCLVWSIATGATSVGIAWLLLRKIYKNVKVD